MKFVLITNNFESSSLFLRLKVLEGQDIAVIVEDPENRKILDGIIEKDDNYIQYLDQGNIFVTDDAVHGEIADALRKRKEKVFGGSVVSDKMENDRSFGQAIMRKCGINTVKSVNFKGEEAFSKATEFLKSKKGRFCLKQNGENDKALSTVGKFEDSQDVIDHMDDFKRIWVSDINFDIQEFVDGHEVGVSAWFNGSEWIKDSKGEVVWELNWEHKKLSNMDMGQSTGETGTLYYRSTKTSKLSKEMLKLTPILKRIKYIGNIDINFIISKKDDKAYGLEFSNRFGYPFLNLQEEFIKTKWSDLIKNCVEGKNNFLEVDPMWATVVVVQVPPFPFESVKDTSNSKGQRIYFLKDGKWSGNDNLSKDKLQHIHFYEVKINKELKPQEYQATGDTGYLATVTAQAVLRGDKQKDEDLIRESNDLCLKRIKDWIYVNNMNMRTDIGVNSRVLDCVKYMREKQWL